MSNLKTLWIGILLSFGLCLVANYCWGQMEDYDYHAKLVKRYTEDPKALESLKLYLQAREQILHTCPKESLNLLERALELDPDGRAIQFAFGGNALLMDLASCYAQSGRHEEAIKTWERVELLDPYRIRSIAMQIFYSLEASRSEIEVREYLERQIKKGKNYYKFHLCEFLVQKLRDKHEQTLIDAGLQDSGWMYVSVMPSNDLEKAILLGEEVIRENSIKFYQVSGLFNIDLLWACLNKDLVDKVIVRFRYASDNEPYVRLFLGLILMELGVKDNVKDYFLFNLQSLREDSIHSDFSEKLLKSVLDQVPYSGKNLKMGKPDAEVVEALMQWLENNWPNPNENFRTH